MINICVIGTGYVGLVSGACLADFGNTVRCVDIDAKRIDTLKKGEMPIFEPGLKDMVARNFASGRLHFSTDLADAVGQLAASLRGRVESCETDDPLAGHGSDQHPAVTAQEAHLSPGIF